MAGRRREVAGVDAAAWERRLREADQFDELLTAVETDPDRRFDVHRDRLRRTSVVRDERGVRVELYSEEPGHGFTVVRGRFDPDDSRLDAVALEQGSLPAPLAGNGLVWELCDGEIHRHRWLS